VAIGVVLRHDILILGAPILVAGLAVDRTRRNAKIGVGAVVTVFAALLVWARAQYGDFMPNTYYLKATGTPTRLVLAAGLRELAPELTMLSIPLVVALAAGLFVFARRDRAVLLGTALVATAAGYDVWVGGDWLSTHPSRFVTPLLPELVLLGVVVGQRAL